MGAKAARPEQASERRDQILAIAARLIASRGYSATTVRDIADEAGILSGSLYHHFPSKEAMLQAILRTFMDDVLGRFEHIAAAGAGPRETLDELIEHAFRTIEQQPDAVSLYRNESSYLSTQPGFEFIAEQSARIEEIWLGQIVAGQRVGVFRDTIDPGIAFRFIRDAVWSTVAWFRPDGRHSAATVSAHYLDLLHHGLLAE
ncbi:TetR/AcrR family transcriptional regulator [Agromyces bauzanensis]